MMSDEVIEELWNVKDAISKEHGHQVRTLVTYLKGKELIEDRCNRNTNATTDSLQFGKPAKPSVAEPS